MAAGTPEEVATADASHTGRYLKTRVGAPGISKKRKGTRGKGNKSAGE